MIRNWKEFKYEIEGPGGWSEWIIRYRGTDDPAVFSYRLVKNGRYVGGVRRPNKADRLAYELRSVAYYYEHDPKKWEEYSHLSKF